MGLGESANADVQTKKIIAQEKNAVRFILVIMLFYLEQPTVCVAVAAVVTRQKFESLSA